MLNYFDKLQRRVEKFRNKYVNQPRKAALKLAWWNLKCVFRKYEQVGKYQKADHLRIAFLLYGGMGDFLISLNYIWYFKRFLNDGSAEIDIYSKHNRDFYKVLGVEKDFVHTCYPQMNDEKVCSDYDLVVDLLLLPEILSCNEEVVRQYAPQLLPLIEQWQECKNNNVNFFQLSPGLNGLVGMYSLAQGRKRIQQADIGNLLNISEDFKFVPAIAVDEKDVLQKFGLNKPFITLNRGVDETNKCASSTKLYPLENFSKLVALLKKEYSDYLVVQLGVSMERCELIENVDINLVGKTTLEDVKVLLKNSVLHVDGEGGMVHLRHALTDKPSCVLFGPTDPKVFGYSNNINLRSTACPICCEWLHDRWSEYCLKTGKEPACLKALAPEKIMKEIIVRCALSVKE